MIKVTDKNFQELLKENEVLVIDFWAPWCGPCKTILPIIDELAEKYAGSVGIAKVNIEDGDCETLIEENMIRSVPTFLFFKDGQLVDKHTGAASKEIIDTKIAKLDFEVKVGNCFNNMINGNVTDEYLIEKYGQSVFDVASEKEKEYINDLD